MRPLIGTSYLGRGVVEALNEPTVLGFALLLFIVGLSLLRLAKGAKGRVVTVCTQWAPALFVAGLMTGAIWVLAAVATGVTPGDDPGLDEGHKGAPCNWTAQTPEPAVTSPLPTSSTAPGGNVSPTLRAAPM